MSYYLIGYTDDRGRFDYAAVEADGPHAAAHTAETNLLVGVLLWVEGPFDTETEATDWYAKEGAP